MYKDHKKGFNQMLADEARTALILRRFSKEYPFKREFDEYGDVVRDYKKELDIYVVDEVETLLPQVNSEYFGSFQTYHLHCSSKPSFQSDVTIVPQLPRTKLKPKQSLSLKVKNALTTNPLPRIAFVLKTFL